MKGILSRSTSKNSNSTGHDKSEEIQHGKLSQFATHVLLAFCDEGGLE